MPSSLIQNNITVIIAHRGSDRHLQDVILDLKLWFNDIVVVGHGLAGAVFGSGQATNTLNSKKNIVTVAREIVEF